MEFTTYYKKGNVLALTNDVEIFVFKWTKSECIVAKCNFALNGDPDFDSAKIVFAWTTSTYNVEEVQKALYSITGKAFELSFDEDYDPIFTEWNLKDTISVQYYYDALYEEFNK